MQKVKFLYQNRLIPLLTVSYEIVTLVVRFVIKRMLIGLINVSQFI